MDLERLISTRRTVGNYRADKISDELVVEALRLSLWAPNHKLSFPWVYILIGPAARAKLADLAVEAKSAKGPLSDVKAKAVRESVRNPSHLLSLGIRRGDPHRQHEDYATLACSVQIMSLYLWSHGVATKWSTGGWSMHERAYDILGVDRERVSLEGALMIGMPLQMPPAPERPRLDELLRRTE